MFVFKPALFSWDWNGVAQVIEASDVLLRLRSRLKDANYSDLRFSDAELLDNINSIATALILEFKLNRTQKFKTLSKTSPELRAAHLIGILEARFNNILLKERTPDKSYQGNLRLYVQDETLSVAPFKEGTLSIIYLAFEPLREVSQTYPLPSLAMDALIYGALSNMLEIPTDDQNYNKIGFYKNLFREAKNQLALYLNRLYSTNSTSRVVRIWTWIASLEIS